MSEALPAGTRIIGGRYILLRLLYERPRVHLYLGWRLPHQGQGGGLVAIRELVLRGLSVEVRAQVVQAAWEEFLSPRVVDALPLPGTDAIPHAWLEAEYGRYYLVMRLFEGKAACSKVTPLADLLQQCRWPRWLTVQVAVAWTIQLARTIARLHRLGTILVDLNPSTILVDESGNAPWPPLLLPSWYPSPSFWPEATGEDVDRAEASFALTNTEDYFPFPLPRKNVFAAPELSSGFYDERADVYALGALLYLLLTHCAPISATLRLLHAHNHPDGLELVSPRFLYPTLPQLLEEVVSRALMLEPQERYPSMFAMVEALEEAQGSQAVALRRLKQRVIS